MRSTANVLKPVISALKAAGNLKKSQLEALCEVEIGLHLQHKLMPGTPAVTAWALFSGYPFARAWGVGVGDERERMLRTARYTLWTLRRRNAWIDALEAYQKLDRVLRGYDVPDLAQPAVRRIVSVVPDRWDHYDKLLHRAPPLAGDILPPAKPGGHRFPVGRTMATLRLPDTPKIDAPISHDVHLLPAGGGRPLTFTWKGLLDTAADMDAKEHQNWVDRLGDIRLFIRADGSFERAEEFSVSRIQHLLGIVGAGKSTLRDVITVHLVNKCRQRVTVVVGDVAEILKLVRLYNTYTEDAAAPILGASGRQQHAQRLHRRLVGRGNYNLLAHDDPGFSYLSTSCVLNALRPEDDGVLAFNEAPCTRLQPRSPRPAVPSGDEYDEPQWTKQRVACPYWSACPRHRGARELVDARIWVATPASLVDAAVPWPQNGERIRYLELACRRSDLVIVDEADRVQMQLDRMFAPAVPLVGGSENRSLLDEVNEHKIRELALGGRTQLSDRDVENWTAAVNTVTAATDRLYAMLVGDHALRKWVEIGYFSAWTLQLRLLDERYPDEDANDEPRAIRGKLADLLDDFRDNPFGDRASPSVAELVGLVNELLHTNHQERTRARLVDLMMTLFDLDPVLAAKEKTYAEAKKEAHLRKGKKKPVQKPGEWLAEMARRFEFTLLLSALEPKLALMNAMWPRVEGALKLGFNEMYRRPLDYGPMVPEAPMGNVLGFQFLVNGPDAGGVRSGELRYFRCSGVGRELLRAMPGLAEVDGHPNTNVLLMSGSSWAGNSSRYHLPVPVGVIIKPQPGEIDHIADRSEMRIEFLEADGRPLQVSGSRVEERPAILRRMAVRLGKLRDGGASMLEEELLALPEQRRHILLLVGSYEEAALVADTLHTLRDRWRGSVLRLVSDDDDVDLGALSVRGDEQHAGVLRRGDVDTLAQTGADVLVAPLLAVERGHNILNSDKQAAIGSVYFLARPNPRPDDLGLAVHAVNDWITRAIEKGEFDKWVQGKDSLDAGASEVRRLARSQWYRVLARTMAWSRLGDDRNTVTWDILVLVWQVIGRLVRGGVPARVVFVDAAFAPNLAARSSLPDTQETSVLHSIHHVLRPYFTGDPNVSAHDRHIVRALYGPLWKSLGRCLRQAAERTVTCTP
jgi:pPIWI RE three-gene island domain Z